MYQRIRRFSRILKLKEDDRRSEQALLAAERREEKDVMDRLFSLEGEKSRAVEDFCGCGGSGSTASCSELWFRRQFIDSIEDRIHEGRDSLQDVRQRIAGTEARLVERHRDVRVMETYVDRLRAADFQSRMDAEQLELDDVAMVRYSRTKKGAEA